MDSAARHGLELQDLIDDADYAASQTIATSMACSVEGQMTNNNGEESQAYLDDLEVVFVKDNVAVHPTQNARINGRLRLLKQGPSLLMTWIPYAQRFANEGASDSTVNWTSNKLGVTSERDRHLYTIRAIPVAEIRSLRRHAPPLGWQYVIIVLTTGLAFPPLYFHNGGIKEFLGTLKEHVHIVRSVDDANLFLVNDLSQDPLQRSLTSLELREVISASAVSTKEQHYAQEQNLARTHSEQSFASVQSTESKSSEDHARDSISNLNLSGRHQQRSRDPARDNIIHVLEKFSLVTKFARDTTAQLFGESRFLVNSDASEEFDCMYGPKKHEERNRRSKEETHFSSVEETDNSQELATFTSMGTPDEYLQTDAANMQGRLPPLSADEWFMFFDHEGRIPESQALRKRVFYGGLEPGVRCEVWKFLLGHFPFGSTHKEREELVVRKHEEYRILKAQWQSISAEQAKRFTKFRERKSRIEKDVVRTDRSFPYYAGDENPHVTILRDILITYSFYNFDLGYCQGMSDFLSPILYVIEDESESFWCFSSLMEHLAPNFHRDQNGMHSQLLALSKLVQLLDNTLHNYFQQADCLNYFFCFRWILIQFKREFAYEDVIRLWEVLWTNYLTEHLHLYMCVGLLKRHRKKIIDEQMDFDTLLKFINELTGHIDLQVALRDAEALFLRAGNLGSACIPPGTPPSLQISENADFKSDCM